MSWTISVRANARDIKGTLLRALDDAIVNDRLSRGDVRQVRAAITAAEVLISSGTVGAAGVAVALSGHAEDLGLGGTVSISVGSVAEEKPHLVEVDPRSGAVVGASPGQSMEAVAAAQALVSEASGEEAAATPTPSAADDDDAGEAVTSPDDVSDPDEVSKAHLVELAREHELPVSGTKAELLERLHEAGVTVPPEEAA